MVPGSAAWRGFDSVNVQMQSSPILASVPLHSDSNGRPVSLRKDLALTIERL